MITPIINTRHTGLEITLSIAIFLVALFSFFNMASATTVNLYNVQQFAEPNTLVVNQDTGTSTLRSFNFSVPGYLSWISIGTFTGCNQNNFGTITLWNITQATTTAISQNVLNGLGGQSFTTSPYVNTTDDFTIGIKNTNGLGNGNSLCFGTSTTVPYLPKLGAVDIEGTQLVPGTATGTVSLVSPTPSSTTYEFDFYTVDYSASIPGQYNIIVIAATSTNDLAFMSNQNQKQSTADYLTGATSTTFVYRSHNVFCNSPTNCSPPDGSQWYAQATLYDSAGRLMAVSAVVPFQVFFSFKNVITPTSTPTSTDYFFINRVCPDPDTIWGDISIANFTCHIGNALRSLGNEIFVGASNRIQDILVMIRSIFPISMITHLQDDINAVSCAANAAPIVIPVNGTNFTIVGTSSIAAAASSTGFSSFRSFMDKLIWLAAGGGTLAMGFLGVALVVNKPS